MRFVVITMEGSQGTALRTAIARLQRDNGIALNLRLYTAPTLRSADDWQELDRECAAADFIFGSMIFGEEYVRPLERILTAAQCPVCVITSNPALIHCTRIGKFTLQPRDEEQEPGLLRQWMRKLRPSGGHGEGQRQLALVRSLSKLLKHLPGKARDLYSYIAVHQYWLNSSPENLYGMLCLLIERYIPGYKGQLTIPDPLTYPDTALFHPEAPEPFADLKSYTKWLQQTTKNKKQRTTARKLDQGVVGVLALRATALSGSTDHLAALTQALEARGIEVRLAYSAGLDFRPAITQFFMTNGDNGAKTRRKHLPAAADVDLLVNTTGFSLVGGPAACRPDEACAMLEQLNVGYLDLIPLIFQRVEDWQRDDTGLAPLQLALNVALPEMDGATEPLVFGGVTAGSESFTALPAQIDLAADRIARRVALRRTANAAKKLAVVLFNFPPNLGNAGTAAYLDVFASVYRLLGELQAEGYSVDLPSSAEALRQAVVEGNALVYGTDGNVAAHLPVADYRQLFPAYAEIEPFWGAAPGELLTDGKGFHILGRQFGNVFVGIQPSFGYERDPFRLLMAKDATPHHGFAAFYTWLEHVFGAHAVLHFGTHGALEFMPGKQAGLSSTCWPSRLLGSLPNVYYYCVNNPSEGTIAKRRSAATLVSYLVPPLQHAGLYKGLRLLKDNLDSYRALPSPELLADIRAQAEKLDISVEMPDTDQAHDVDEAYAAALAHELIQVEQRMIPVGLHVLDTPPATEELVDVLAMVAAFQKVSVTPDALSNSHPVNAGAKPAPLPAQITLPALVAAGRGLDYADLVTRLKHDHAAQEEWDAIDAICREAMRLFVETQAQSRDNVDAYLQQAARITPGMLAPLWSFLDDLLTRLVANQELAGLLHALRGGYIAPSPGNDVVRNPAVVPTGRNLHGLDPYHMPTTAAQETGARLVQELLARLTREHGALPETVALVLWGTDNLKSDGEGVAQVLALLGARAVSDELGKISDVALIPLVELGRPRIDVVVTVSGIFRDLLRHQMSLLDKAVHLAATADEPLEQNFVRKHALAQSAELEISLDEAAARIFSNAPGSYGANVNHLVESSTWEQEDQLGEAFMSRKSFTFTAQGEWREVRPVMERALATVDATFQNIDGFELGVSDIDHYYEYLGGVTKSVELVRGKRPTVLVADAIATNERVSSLEQMVRLETRAKLLNPKWFEGMLAHGYEGVHEIEARVSNTYGWSATASAVDGWVYQGVTETFLLDDALRERMAQLNPHATAAVARRMLEAHSRGFWEADAATLEALRDIYDDLEDRLEGVGLATRTVSS
jgi:magnesium chelatase subunit H